MDEEKGPQRLCKKIKINVGDKTEKRSKKEGTTLESWLFGVDFKNATGQVEEKVDIEG